MSDLTDHIETDATKAQSVTVDGQTIVRRSVDEQIKADQYLKANDAIANRNPRFGLRCMQIVPPGGG